MPLTADATTFNRDHLGDCYRSSEDERRAALEDIVRSTPDLMAILTSIKRLGLPDGWLVSGGVYQTVWNALTGRPTNHGIKDYDIIYFDGADLSYEGEDAVINAVETDLPLLAERLETKNQARVHLWYEKRFGRPYPPLSCSMESLTFYASKTHAVAVRLRDDGQLDIHAPFGLSNIFGMRLAPNHAFDSRHTYLEKGARMKAQWPELELEPWHTQAD